MTIEANGQVLATHTQVANTYLLRLFGLMGRKSLPRGSALWIQPCRGGIHTFFMRFSIDVLFLDSKLSIVTIRRNVKPWRMSLPLTTRVTSVIEFPGGTLNAFHLNPGDQIHVCA